MRYICLTADSLHDLRDKMNDHPDYRICGGWRAMEIDVPSIQDAKRIYRYEVLMEKYEA